MGRVLWLPLSRKVNVAGLIIGILLSGCATSVSPEMIASTDYGPPPPDNHQEIVRAAINRRLSDPTSGIFEFGPPSKGYTKGSQMHGTDQAFGWRVCGSVNSKNRFGGYVGDVPFLALFQGEQVTQLVIGRITDNEYGINFTNSAIFGACRRKVVVS